MYIMTIPEGEYNAVISLGSYCIPAQMLKLAGLRKRSHIFDWLVIDHNQLCTVINDKFEDFALKQNLRLLPSGDVLDTHSGTIFMHHFRGHKNGAPFLDDYEHYKTTLLRRVQAFKEILDSSARVLFIRLAHHSHPPDDCGEIEKCVLNAAPNLNCSFLFINNQSERYSSSRSQSFKHPAWREDWWLHNDEIYNIYWRELFSKIELTTRAPQDIADTTTT